MWNAWLTYRLINTPTVTISTEHRDESGHTTSVTYTVGEITEVVEEVRSGVVTVNVVTDNVSKAGSGVLFAQENEDVYLFTASSLLTESTSVSVVFDSGALAEAEIVGTDKSTGLALLKCTPSFEVTIPVHADTADILQGTYSVAIGGRRPSTQKTMVSSGAISGSGFSVQESWIALTIDTDATVNDGNIGGGLFTGTGELMGILIQRTDFQKNFGTAADVHEAEFVFEELKNEEEVKRGSLGVSGRNVSEMRTYEKSQRDLSLDLISGVLVTYAAPSKTPDMNDNGIQEGDIIVSIEDTEITDINALYSYMYTKEAGDSVKVKVVRGGSEMNLEVVLQ